MKRHVALLVLSLAVEAGATPSTTFWTPCTIDIQAYKTGHITYDNYTTLGRKSPARGGQAFPIDLGLTVGILPWEKLQMEVGIDWLEPSDDPAFFNAKIGSPEGALFKGSPALEAGLFNVGTKTGVTDLNVGYLVTGRSLPGGAGRLHLGAYLGNPNVLRASDGALQNTGVMAAYDYGFWQKKSHEGDYDRLVLAGDFASGRNAIGGGGAGLYYYFTKHIDLLTGPVWFNDAVLNGDWKWTTQLDVNF